MIATHPLTTSTQSTSDFGPPLKSTDLSAVTLHLGNTVLSDPNVAVPHLACSAAAAEDRAAPAQARDPREVA